MKATVTLGPGTHAIKGGLRSRGDWFHDGSDFCKLAAEHHIQCDYFPWTTALAGAEFWKPWLGIKPNLQDWEIAALNLKEMFLPRKVDSQYWPQPSRVHLITHSHGAQPAIIAAALGLKINVLVTVSAPIRQDVLQEYGARARRNIRFHLEYFSINDRIQMAGGFGDGHYGVMRRFGDFKVNGESVYRADEPIVMPEECGHSELLHNPKFMGEMRTAFQRILDRDGCLDASTGVIRA